jgi:hypothetical protein
VRKPSTRQRLVFAFIRHGIELSKGSIKEPDRWTGASGERRIVNAYQTASIVRLSSSAEDGAKATATAKRSTSTLGSTGLLPKTLKPAATASGSALALGLAHWDKRVGLHYIVFFRSAHWQHDTYPYLKPQNCGNRRSRDELGQKTYGVQQAAPHQNEYFRANCSDRMVLAEVITPKFEGLRASELGAFQLG